MISQLHTALPPTRTADSGVGDTTPAPESAASRGERADFDHFVRRHAPGLRRFLTRRVPGEAVDDVLQEVLITTWTSRPGALANLPALYRIARCKAVDWFRHHARRSARETTLEGDHPYTQDDFARLDDRILMAGLIAKLPLPQQETIKMYYEDGLTLAEIAQTQGRGLSATKYHFYRAHEEIARLWREAQDTQEGSQTR